MGDFHSFEARIEFRPLIKVRFKSRESARHFAEGYVLGRSDDGFRKTIDIPNAAPMWETAYKILRVDDDLIFAERLNLAEWPTED